MDYYKNLDLKDIEYFCEYDFIDKVEQWKDILGYEGHYQISDLGRVKSFKLKNKGRILSVKNKNGWYLSFRPCINGKAKTHRIHVLVCKHFIQNPENKKYVNHKNSNKQYNLKGNLEWCTQSENSKHAISNNPNILKGINDYNKNRSQIILQFDLKGIFIEEHFNGVSASHKTKVCERNIYQVASKTEYKKGLTRKQAGGFIWKYKE